jgi:hypothetical protein
LSDRFVRISGHYGLGDMLYERGRQLEHAYFPVTAIVSLLYVTRSGASSEIAGVGSEGIDRAPRHRRETHWDATHCVR